MCSSDLLSSEGGGYDGFVTRLSEVSTITFAPGALTATLQIDPVADALVEGDETVVVRLLGGSGYVVGSAAVASGTIEAPATCSIEAAGVRVAEGSAAVFTLTTTKLAAGSELAYVLSGAGISAGDVRGGRLTGTVTVGGDGRARLEVELEADRFTEGTETLTATVMGQSARVEVDDASRTQVGVTVSPAAVSENGTRNLVYTFTRTGDPGAGLAVNFLVGGEAGNADFASSVALPAEPLLDWSAGWSTREDDSVNALTMGLDGAVYAGGWTFGSRSGLPATGAAQAFLARYRPDGTEEWTKLLAASGNAIRLRQCMEYPIVLADPDVGGRQLLDGWLQKTSHRIAPVIQSNSFEFLRACLRYDQALTFQIALGAFNHGGELVAREIEDRGFPRGNLVLAHLKGRSLPVAASAFAHHVQSRLLGTSS